jgi:hypothetical protein
MASTSPPLAAFSAHSAACLLSPELKYVSANNTGHGHHPLQPVLYWLPISSARTSDVKSNNNRKMVSWILIIWVHAAQYNRGAEEKKWVH